MWKFIILFVFLLEIYLINYLLDSLGFINTFLFYIVSGFLGKVLSSYFLSNKGQTPSALLKGLGSFLILLPVLSLKLLGLILIIPGVSFLLMLGFSTFIMSRLQQAQQFKWYPKSAPTYSDVIETTAKRLDN